VLRFTVRRQLSVWDRVLLACLWLGFAELDTIRKATRSKALSLGRVDDYISPVMTEVSLMGRKDGITEKVAETDEALA
jgi:hypothetical protein